MQMSQNFPPKHSADLASEVQAQVLQTPVPLPCVHVYSYGRVSWMLACFSEAGRGPLHCALAHCTENFGFFKKPATLWECVFVFIPGVGCGAASDSPQKVTMICLMLLQGCDSAS